MTEMSRESCHHCNRELTGQNGLRLESMDRGQATLDTRDKGVDSCEGSKAEETEATAAPPLLRILGTFAGDTTIHGLKYTADRRKHPFFRLLWALLGIGATVALVSLLVTLFRSYHKYPVKTVIAVTPTDELPFPAVTICNLNSFEASKIKSLDSDKYNVSLAMSALSVASSIFGKLFNSSMESLEKTIPIEVLNWTFQDVTQSVFPDLDSTLIACFWEGREENCGSMFTPVDLETTRCFQFNGDLAVRRRVSTHSGLSNGLQVLVNVKQEDYIYNEALSAGVQVILHEPGELPDVTNTGFMASPGFSTFASTAVQKHHYLPAPFKAFGEKTCVNDAPRWDDVRRSENITYTLALQCQKICTSIKSQAACGCRLSDNSFTYDPTLPLCTIKDVYSCYKQLFKYLQMKPTEMECACPRLCHKTEYHEVTSLAYFPSDAVLNLLDELRVINKTSIRKNYLDLKIYYGDLVYHEVAHVAEYTMYSILGTLGGHMGLFVGASILSIAEVVELLYRLCTRIVRAMCCRQKPTHVKDKA